MACHYKPYHLHYQKKIIDAPEPRTGSALIIMNVQKAFLPGGSMGILNNRADRKNQSLMMINSINALIDSNRFDYHIYVQDAHRHDDSSFASARPGSKPFQIIDVEHNGITHQQILWPDHCRIDGRDYAPRSITGSSEHQCKSGAGIQFATELRVPESFLTNGDSPEADSTLSAKSFVINVGEGNETDSYSAFKDYYGGETGLAQALISKGVRTLYVVGLARDFGAWWTALDGSSYVDSDDNEIFDVKFVWDATLPAPGSDKLLEYEYDGEIDSPHHSRLRSAVQSNEYGVSDVMKGLVNNDPMGNRWVETYLSPYGVTPIKTADLLNIPVDATFGIMEDLQTGRVDNNEQIVRIDTRENKRSNNATDLNFLNKLRIQDTASTLRTDELDI